MKIRKIIPDKNGLLLAEQTLKMIIALISILFLVYFLTALYFGKIKEEKRVQAVDRLIDSTGSLKVSLDNLALGDSKTELIEQPFGWVIYTFTGTGTKPQACGRDNCLCICDNEWNFRGDARDEYIQECNENGACLDLAKLKNYEKELIIEIVKGVEINIEKNSEGEIVIK